MTYKTVLSMGVAAAAMALCTSSANAALIYGGQIDSSYHAVTPNPVSSTDAQIVTGGDWSPFNDSTSPWLDIIQTDGAATFNATNTFTFIWGSPSSNNIVTLNGPTTLTYNENDLAPYHVRNQPDTYGYLVTVTGDFSSVTLSETGGGNFEVGFTAVPEPATWAMMGLGFAGLAFAGYRSRRTAISIA